MHTHSHSSERLRCSIVQLLVCWFTGKWSLHSPSARGRVVTCGVSEDDHVLCKTGLPHACCVAMSADRPSGLWECIQYCEEWCGWAHRGSLHTSLGHEYYWVHHLYPVVCALHWFYIDDIAYVNVLLVYCLLHSILYHIIITVFIECR